MDSWRDRAGRFGTARMSGGPRSGQTETSATRGGRGSGVPATNQQGGNDGLLAQVQEEFLQGHGLIVHGDDEVA